MDGMLVLGAVFAAMALAVMVIVQLRRRYGANGANGDYSGDGGHSHHGNDDGGCDGGDGGGD